VVFGFVAQRRRDLHHVAAEHANVGAETADHATTKSA